MTFDDDERRASLIAGELAGDLTADEAAELDRLRLADPTIDRELSEGRTLTQRLAGLGEWQEPSALPPLNLHDDAPPRRVWRGVGLALAAAACIAIGAIGGIAVQDALQAPATGPAGTLGAVEQVSFSPGSGGTTVEGAVIAHTWGTEASLELAGLTAGETYTVVLVGTDGEEFVAGTILGTSNVVTCRMNAAVLREDVGNVEIRSEDDAVVTVAALEPVGS